MKASFRVLSFECRAFCVFFRLQHLQVPLPRLLQAPLLHFCNLRSFLTRIS